MIRYFGLEDPERLQQLSRQDTPSSAAVDEALYTGDCPSMYVKDK
jgi:hypothetical protein